MFRYSLKKILFFLLSLWVVVTLTFILVHAIPGDPFTDEETVPEEILVSLQRYYGLDKPLMVQYKEYIVNLLRGDLGPSLKYQGRTTNDIIRESFPISVTLGLEALCIAVFIGIPLGAIAALKKGKWQDSFVMCTAVLGISLPSFILATFLQYLFAIQLDWFPIARASSFLHTVLPALALAALPTATTARLTRSSMVEVLEQDYILTARAKGLSARKVIYRHALRNSLLPVIAYLGPLAATVLTGSFVVEKIFGIPGLGQWFVISVANRDYALILSLTLFYSIFLMVATLLVDLVSAWIDPRIKVAP